MNFSGKRVLVTGGTGALGSVVTQRFVDAGATVTSTVRTAAEAREQAPTGVTLLAADVTDEGEVERLFATLGPSGAIAVLVNLAGAYAGGKAVRDMATEEWDRMMNVNLRSVFLCSRGFLRQRTGASFGRIISIAAMPAFRPAAGKAAYAVSKAGVVSLTQMLAEEVKGSGVTVNAIAPGIIDTPANRAWSGDADRSGWVTPAAIAEQIIMLCSEQSAAINGACIPMYGGL